MNRSLIPWIAAGLAITALFWIDPLFFPLALLGPILSGAVAGARAVSLTPLLAMWVVAGVGAVVSDFVVNQEDVVFHVALTLVMAGLAALAWWIARAVARRRAPAPA